MSRALFFQQRCAGCQAPGPGLCGSCRFAFESATVVGRHDGVLAAAPFDGVVRTAVLALKYRNRRGVARLVATWMVRRLGVRRDEVDLVTWAPTSRHRVAQRGFDQAELLARAVARELGVPCRRLLYRSHGAAQTGRGRAERLAGPEFRSRPATRPLRVLVVDDVVTTGATLRAAASALQRAGVSEVRMIAAAATPASSAPWCPGRRRSIPVGFGLA